jgi:hypothetical protein
MDQKAAITMAATVLANRCCADARVFITPSFSQTRSVPKIFEAAIR